MNSLFRKTYGDKKVFITGHTGFKGAWLSLWLQQLGAEVKGYALAPAGQSLYRLLGKNTEVQSVIADIRNRSMISRELKNFRPDYIFHLAAQPLVRHSYLHSAETFEVNAMGTVNLLDALSALNNPCAAVIVTTDKVYENKGGEKVYTENDRLGGHDPYSASKACAEIIVQSYRLSFFNPAHYDRHRKSIATARAGNVIGGGDFSEDRIIPDLFRTLQKNRPLHIRNPHSVRPWQHVLDPLAGYLLLGAKMTSGKKPVSDAYNFGPGKDELMSVETLVQKAITAYGKGKYVIAKKDEQPHEADFLVLDNSKARRELGWKPVYNTERAIKNTMEWYKKSLEKSMGIFDLCVNEIENFTSAKTP